VLIANVETAGIDLDIQTLIQHFGVAAVIGIPLSVGRQELGFVMVGFRKAQIFEADLSEPLMALASQAAIALQNQRSSAASRATLQQLDEINRRLTGQAWSGYTAASGGAMHKLDLGPNGPVSDTGPLPTILSAPVMVRGQTIGSLRLEDDAPDREWTPSETALIQAVAGEVAIALENTRLIEETEKRASREARLNQISQQLRQATNINSILQTAAEQLSLALDTSHAQAQLGTSRPTAPRPNGQRDGSAEDSL
jgi:GAF domain-containing protein